MLPEQKYHLRFTFRLRLGRGGWISSSSNARLGLGLRLRLRRRLEGLGVGLRSGLRLGLVLDSSFAFVLNLAFDLGSVCKHVGSHPSCGTMVEPATRCLLRCLALTLAQSIPNPSPAIPSTIRRFPPLRLCSSHRARGGLGARKLRGESGAKPRGLVSKAGPLRLR